MSQLSVEAARRRGAVFEALRQAGFLPITRSQAGDEYIQQRFGIAPKTFWKIIRELEADREVRMAPEGLYFVAPQDRW
jgi:hypothetical protein